MHPYRTPAPRELRPIPAPLRHPWGTLLLLSSGLLAVLSNVQACVAAPSQHDEARFGVVTMAHGQGLDGITDWRRDQLPYFTDEVLALSDVGPTFRELDEGTATLVARTFDSGPHCAGRSGRFTVGLNFFEIDPACCDGYPALQRAIAHEALHWLTSTRWGWHGHICEHAGDAPDCHGSIFGPAILNPALGYLDDGPGFDAVWTPTNPDPNPTVADLALIARCQSRGACE